MKKYIAILFLAALLAGTFALTACGTLFDKYYSRLSDWRDVVLTGANDNFAVNIISGFREREFAMDGESTDKIDYVVITITPNKAVEGVTVSVSIEGTDYQLPCDKHPLGTTYSAEVQSRTQVTQLTLTVNGEEITATTVAPELTVTGENAMEIATDTIDFSASDEIYVRITDNPVISDGKYYWYVASYSGGSTKAVLIDVITGTVLAHRI